MRTLCVLLLLAAPLSADVITKGSPVTCAVVSAASCVAGPVTVAIGDTIIVIGFRGSVITTTPGPIPILSDSCGNSYNAVASGTSASTPFIFAAVPAAAGSCNITAVRTDAQPSQQGFIAQVFSGVAAVSGGSVTGGGQGGSFPNRYCNAPSVTVTSSDVAIGGFVVNGTGTPATNTFVAYPPSLLIDQVQIGTTGAGNGNWIGMVQVSGEGAITPAIGLNFSGSLGGCARAAAILEPAPTPPPLVATIVYWMHPPIIAGNGITVDYQPDGSYVSLSAARGIGGVVVISGDVDTGKCIVRKERHTGLRLHSHIAVGRTPEGVRVTATVERNQVDFRVCNSSQRAVHLNPFRLTWHEAYEAHSDRPAAHR